MQPGGWAFQYDNALLPRPRRHGHGPDGPREGRRASTPTGRDWPRSSGLGWFLGMQNQDGGWASFDADNNRLFLNNIPFADHGALLDPSTEDLTGRGLELLGTLGYGLDFEPADRALDFIRHSAAPRRPLVRPLGRELHLRHLVGAARARGHRRRPAPRVRPAGGALARAAARTPTAAGARPARATPSPSWPAAGESIPSQTAWALLALFAAGHIARPRRRARHRLPAAHAAAPTARWDDALWNGTGFPRVFYLKYHLYAQLFPALGAGRLPPRACMTEPAVAPALRPFEGLGRLGDRDRRVARSLRQLPAAGRRRARHAAVQAAARFVGRIHYIGFSSLLIILLTGRVHRDGARAADLLHPVAVRLRGVPRARPSRSRSSASSGPCWRR